VFGQEFDGRAIGDGIGLRQIIHRLHQHLLAVHVAGIGRALAFFARQIWRNGDGKHFGHANSTFEGLMQYIAAAGLFQLDSVGSDFA
jgi:hypothetical protein